MDYRCAKDIVSFSSQEGQEPREARGPRQSDSNFVWLLLPCVTYHGKVWEALVEASWKHGTMKVDEVKQTNKQANKYPLQV